MIASAVLWPVTKSTRLGPALSGPAPGWPSGMPVTAIMPPVA